MKKSKSTKLLAVFATLSLALAACSSDSSSSDSNKEKKNKSGKDEKVTIIYARGKDVTKGTTKMVEAFEKAHKNIDVKFQEMPADTGQQHDQYVTAFNAKSTEIDV